MLIAVIVVCLCLAGFEGRRAFADSSALPVIIIDPGHGGSDRGAAGPGGLPEKQVCLDLARRLQGIVGQKARVVMTRSEDYGVSLVQRASLANHNQGDLFISLHTGAGFTRTINGHSIYYDLPPDRDPGQGSSAGGKDLLPLQWDCVQHGHAMSSARLAQSLRASLAQISMPSAEPDVFQAPMVLLHGLDMPAVIYEAGYLTHPTMEKRFEDAQYLDSLAQALAAGIFDFIQN